MAYLEYVACWYHRTFSFGLLCRPWPNNGHSWNVGKRKNPRRCICWSTNRSTWQTNLKEFQSTGRSREGSTLNHDEWCARALESNYDRPQSMTLSTRTNTSRNWFDRVEFARSLRRHLHCDSNSLRDFENESIKATSTKMQKLIRGTTAVGPFDDRFIQSKMNLFDCTKIFSLIVARHPFSITLVSFQTDLSEKSSFDDCLWANTTDSPWETARRVRWISSTFLALISKRE